MGHVPNLSRLLQWSHEPEDSTPRACSTAVGIVQQHYNPDREVVLRSEFLPERQFRVTALPALAPQLHRPMTRAGSSRADLTAYCPSSSGLRSEDSAADPARLLNARPSHTCKFGYTHVVCSVCGCRHDVQK